jgi:ketosteroid isomerase-like protein
LTRRRLNEVNARPIFLRHSISVLYEDFLPSISWEPCMLISVVALLSSLNAAAHAAPVDSVAVKAALMEADRALADKTGKDGPRAFLSALDGSAALLIPGQPILAARNAGKAFTARYGSPSTFWWRPIHAVVSVDGNFGCTTGFSRFMNAADTARVERKGTYITCWQRGAGGKWKIVGHQRTDSPPRAPLLADSTTMSFAPHSATVSIGKNQLRAAQDADAAFAKLGSEPDGPGPAFVHYAATDAVMLGGARFPHGLREIAAAFDGFPADEIIKWDPMRSFGAASGGLAYTVGHSTNGPRGEKAEPVQYNKYMTVWRQNPDGRWVYIFDLGSSRK